MSVNAKMTAIANAIRSKTWNMVPLTLDKMATEIARIPTGSGFPMLIYQTIFEVEQKIQGGSGTLCTISTGIADPSAHNNLDTLIATIERNSDVEVDSSTILSVQQPIFSIFSGFSPSQSMAKWTTYDGSNARFTNAFSNADHIYVSALTRDLSVITLSYRAALAIFPGIYTIKLYRTGFENGRNY